MIKSVWSLYNTVSKSYGDPMVFENDDLAYAQMRRYVRDMYMKDELNIDALSEYELVKIAEFDNVIAEFRTDFDWKKYDFMNFVVDLIGDEFDI